MKKIKLLLLTILLNHFLFAQNKTIVYDFADLMPEFPGGDSALLYYIAENTEYPTDAWAQGIEGRVYVKFIVDTNGIVKSPIIVRSANPLLDSSAIRTTRNMRRWIPGMKDGKYVSVYVTLPCTFKKDMPQPTENEPYALNADQVDQMPIFPGNVDSYIHGNFKLTGDLPSNDFKGRVVAKFIVTDIGKVDSVKIIQHLYPPIDEEVIRLIKIMPPWRPALKNGKRVNVWLTAPFDFAFHFYPLFPSVDIIYH